jgi:hypothetical protein
MPTLRTASSSSACRSTSPSRILTTTQRCCTGQSRQETLAHLVLWSLHMRWLRIVAGFRLMSRDQDEAAKLAYKLRSGSSHARRTLIRHHAPRSDARLIAARLAAVSAVCTPAMRQWLQQAYLTSAATDVVPDDMKTSAGRRRGAASCMPGLRLRHRHLIQQPCHFA